MVERAQAGRSVVRLKGGDPFVFGRGGEEAEALAAAGVPFEVVPGVTAGVAAPAYAGIPLTHREDASAVAFVTAHEDPGKDGSLLLDWEALARFPGTLVLYMGVKRLPEVAERLVQAGRDASEPAAAVERGTMAGQRTVTATLAELPAAASAAGLHPPAIVLTARWRRAARRSVGWSGAPSTAARGRHPGARPGQRSRGDAARAGRRGRRAAGDPDRARLDSAEVRDAVQSIHAYALVCLTSPNRVSLLFDALAEAGRRARARQRDGRRDRAGTAARSPSTGSGPTWCRSNRSPRPRRGAARLRCRRPAVLVARAAEARDVLPDALRERGAKVDVVAL